MAKSNLEAKLDPEANNEKDALAAEMLKIRKEFQLLKYDVEESIQFLSRHIHNISQQKDIHELTHRINLLDQRMGFTETRLERYANLFGLGLLRKVRRKLKKLPPPPAEPK